MNEQLKNFLATGYTPYQVCENAAKMLEGAGFKKLTRSDLQAEKGGKYYLIEGGTLIAYVIGSGDGFNIATAHTDSPLLKLKGERAVGGDLKRLNCEVYGGAINYSFFDIPLRIAGCVYTDEKDGVKAHSVVSPYRVHIPSLAIHQNRSVNSGFAPSVQTDMLPLLGSDGDFMNALIGDKTVLDFDLYACPDVTPFESGPHGEYLCSPRLDNLTSVYAAVSALTKAKPKGVAMAVCFNSEETGSRTYSAANSSFLSFVLEEIAKIRGMKNYAASSFMLSADNAHAAHPAHPEKSDPVNQVPLGGGVVIKKHPNYATDGYSAARLKKLLNAAKVPYSTFYSNSDLPCGSTVGLIAAANTGIRTCDIGIAQLAMHSAVETCHKDDIEHMTRALSALFNE